MQSIHAFKARGIGGQEIDFAAFRGRKIMVVNVASECGYTPQYEQLQELYENFKDKLVIVGFPSNDFGSQEPAEDAEIAAFCTSIYGVSFPMASKVTIIGPHPHPVYQWLTQKTLNGVADSEVRWNFQKYLLDESGQLTGHLVSSISPFDEVVLDWINS